MQDIKVYLSSLFSSTCSAGRNNYSCTSIYIISSYTISDLCTFPKKWIKILKTFLETTPNFFLHERNCSDAGMA